MALGWPSVAAGLAHISSRELSEWQAYETVCGPVGPQRTDHHFARLMWLISNMMRREEDRIPLADFMPFVRSEDAPEIISVHPGVVAYEQLYGEIHPDDATYEDEDDE